MPFVICSTGDALAFKVAVANQTSATCDGARGKEDIYSVFAWLHANAGQLALDPTRIGIKGESGGGGFAAAAALYARDRQGPKFAFQHLIYPMIDDRTAVRKDLHPYVGEFVWTQENNYFGWRPLLGEEPGAADVSPYAAAARQAARPSAATSPCKAPNHT
jgi:acetyl esterase/lipase